MCFLGENIAFFFISGLFLKVFTDTLCCPGHASSTLYQQRAIQALCVWFKCEAITTCYSGVKLICVLGDFQVLDVREEPDARKAKNVES